MLGAGCEEMSVDVGSDERGRLLTYLDLVVRWNRVYNLTAVREPSAMLTQHLLDCLAVLPVLDRTILAPAATAMAAPSAPPRAEVGVDTDTVAEGAVAAARAAGPCLMDVGAGAGLPGLVLALARPALAVALVEPVGKKAAFLQQCVAELGLATRVRVHNGRVERLAGSLAPRAFICRAFASLADYATAIGPLVRRDSVVFAMKARRAEIEREATHLPTGWGVAQVDALSVPGLNAERHLVRLRAPGH
jgi:16S rRNA (guanine527-N7)-methyltransferase